MPSGPTATPYRGRFAPSPTGPLHAGSLVAALASWLDARAHRGRWLVRIEDLDRPRCRAGAAETILRQLAGCGLVPDEPPVQQSAHTARYTAALDRLVAAGWAYPCGCSRREIEAASAGTAPAGRAPGDELVYPGTCRTGLHGRVARAWRVRVAPALDRNAAPSTADPAPAPLVLDWHDRRLGARRQDVSAAVGDFVLRRADGVVAYQLVVVVDDAAQGIGDVVRGADLADNTPRQIHLQRLLGLPTPRYLHVPLVLGADGEKLSKRHDAPAVDADGDPLGALRAAGRTLGLTGADTADRAAWLEAAVAQWAGNLLDSPPREVEPRAGNAVAPLASSPPPFSRDETNR